jgi:uncharacterized protein (UPF0332 family)
MNKDVNALIADRINKAEEAFDLAKLAIEKSYWISATNRLYYTCFYLITALYAKYNIRTHTHAGVKAVFASHLLEKV